MSEDKGANPGKENAENPSLQSESRRSSISRRQILKGGAVAAPAILTLTSRPVLGQVWNPGFTKCSFAVWESANPSNPLDCGQCPTPGNWKNLTGGITRDDWIAAGFDPGECTGRGGRVTCTGGTPFNAEDFGGTVPDGSPPGRFGPFPGNVFPTGTSMRQVMLQYNSHPGNLACAAILNASYAANGNGLCGLTVGQVNALWDDFINSRITAGDFKDFLGAAFDAFVDV
jgi:hypothetical protein